MAGLLRDVAFSAIYFPLCAGLKAHMGPIVEGQLHMSQGAGCTAAALTAGAIAAFATAPLDVIKTRVQASIGVAGPRRSPVASASPAAFVVAFSSDDPAQACGEGRLGCEVPPAQAMTVPSVGMTVRDLIEREGTEALFRGVCPRVSRGGSVPGLGFRSRRGSAPACCPARSDQSLLIAPVNPATSDRCVAGCSQEERVGVGACWCV
jgi:hypothetical protein